MEAMDGRLSIGQLVILNLLFRQLAGQLRQMAQLIQRRAVYQVSRRAGAAFWERLRPLDPAVDPAVDGEIRAARGSGADPVPTKNVSAAYPALAVRDLGFATREGQWVLRGLDFELPPGATLGLVGASGAGKSTLLKLLCGLYRPTQGGVWREGRHCDRMPGNVYLSQKEFLFGGTVGDNILLGRSALGAGPDWLLSELDLPPDRRRAVCRGATGSATGSAAAAPSAEPDRLPQASDPASGLSGGERQVVFLARALQSTQAMASTGLFLDEPTTALDPARSQAVASRMWRAGKEVGLLVFATHDLALAAEADYLLWLAEGRQLVFGPSQEVLAAWRTQAGVGTAAAQPAI
jgi:ATP-binding cassette subfamily B protein